MEKYARQAVTEGVNCADELQVGGDSELYRVLNLHYNRNNHIEVLIYIYIYIYCSKQYTHSMYISLCLNMILLFYLRIFILFDLHIYFLYFVYRYRKIFALWSSKHFANSFAPSKVVKIPNNRGRRQSIRSFRAWTIQCPNISSHPTFWNNWNKRKVNAIALLTCFVQIWNANPNQSKLRKFRQQK